MKFTINSKIMKVPAFISLCLIFTTKAFALDENGQHYSTKPAVIPNYRSLCKYRVGDHRCCLRENNKLLRMEALPGAGWDDLRNLDMGIVIQRNYSQCLTSEDGKYLIPDNTYVVPLKESKVVLKSEYFEHWNNYSSLTSNSIKTGAHGSIFGIGLGGKFSLEREAVKKQQVLNKTVITRVQLRYKFYTVKAQPDMQLHPDFKSRLLDIAANMQCNNTAIARYLADLLVRDYGTHYVKSIEAGATFTKVDYIKSKYATSFENNKRKLKASASASFFGLFGPSIGVSYPNQASKQNIDAYTRNIAYSEINSNGGPPYRANLSIKQWEDGLPNNLVAIDRSGDPLHYVITPKVLPELPKALTQQLKRFVLKSIKSYYKHNIIKGCMDASSPNFNFQAVLDDHSCGVPFTNFTFGGVYQTCSISGSPSSNPCGAFQQKNPKKNDYLCPDEYDAVLLHQGRTPSTCRQECHGWWIFKSCHDDCGYAKYNTYWCVATAPVKDHSGYLFGGLYTKKKKNAITGTASCPPKFYPQRFGPEGMYVCISDDYELAARYRLPIAGFFSCSAGNPLAIENNTSSVRAIGVTGSTPKADPSNWPKYCPVGYSQHLAIIDEDCEINYCVKANTLSVQGLPTIKRPPFRSLPKISHDITIPLTITNVDTGNVWSKDPKSMDWILDIKEKADRKIDLDEATNTFRPKGIQIKIISDKDVGKGSRESFMDSMEIFKQRTNSSSSSSSEPTRGTMPAILITIGVIASVALVVIVELFVLRPKRRQSCGTYDRLSTVSSNYKPVKIV